MTSFPDGTARSVKSPATNLPPSHGDKDSAKCISSAPNFQRSNDSKPLHLMSKECHYPHYNSDKLTLHKFWFTLFIALRIANNYDCQLLPTYLLAPRSRVLLEKPTGFQL
jgi:hypothetical protein